jgi:hypothetical protein
MEQISFDFNNMFSHSVGGRHGVTESEFAAMRGAIAKAYKHIKAVLENESSRINLGFEWTKLPFQDSYTIGEIQALADDIARNYENVISLGIGG